MISVFVCEDNENYMKFISKAIKNLIFMEGLDMELVLCTEDPAEIIQRIKYNNVNGLYFLDIELEGGYNGIQVAQSIRKHDPRGFIVFITAYPQYLDLTFKYKVEALDYIQKDTEDIVCKRVFECIHNAYQKYVDRSYSGRFIFKSRNGCKISCAYNDILFFETASNAPRRIVLHTRKRQYTFYGTLDNILEELPRHNFIQCHKSFVVNVDNLTEKCRQDLIQGKDKITMPNGSDCYVSVRKRKDLIRVIR
jgi:two-component system response regulator AgrA